MKKEIYVPKEKELSKIKDVYSSIYGDYLYLICKTAEKLISDYKFITSMPDELRKISELLHAICYVYPQEALTASEYMSLEEQIRLFNRQIDKPDDDSIRKLDVLEYYHGIDEAFVKSNSTSIPVVTKTVSLLTDKLKGHPAYRFDYKPSSILDAIFTVDTKLIKPKDYSDETIDLFSQIDPAYSLQNGFKGRGSANSTIKGMDAYLSRFGFETRDVDTVNPTPEKVHTLKRYLDIK